MSNNAGSRGLDLSSLFNVATQALAANQSSLNRADAENQNHGDNMVQAFSMITQALASQQGAAPSLATTDTMQASICRSMRPAVRRRLIRRDSPRLHNSSRDSSL